MNRIYRVIFNRSRGLYQVVSEIAKRGGKEKSSRTSGSSLRRGAGIALCIAGIIGGTLSVHAADEYVLKTTFDQQVKAIDTKVDDINAKAIANQEAINDITKQGGKLDQTIDQVNTIVSGYDGSMNHLQEKQSANSGEIAKLKTSVADITKQGGTLDKAIQNAVQKLTSTGGAVDTNKNAIATNAGNIQANKDQIGKNTQALDALNGRVSQNEKDIKQNKEDIKQNKEDIKNLKQTVSDNKTAAENELKAAKTELNKTITDTKSDLQNKINTTKSDLEKVIGDNKKDADTALTTVKNDLQGKINTTNQNLNQAKTDLTNKINNDVNNAKATLSGQISGVQRTLQGKIDATNQTVASNQRATAKNLKELEDRFTKRVSGQKAGQKNLGLDFETGKLGFRYFRTSMDNQSDADPKGANSMAIGVSTTSGEGSIGIAAGGPAGALTAGGENSIGIGNGVKIDDKENGNTIAIGTEAKILKQSEGAIAIGQAANIVATNKYAIAIGAATQTYAEESMALGHSAKTYMKGGVAIGQDAQVGEYIEQPMLDGDVKQDGLGTGIDGIAIGRGAQTLADQTISIGAEAGLGMKRTGTIPLAASHIVIGNQAGQSMQGMENIALGYKSGGNVQSNYNISIGSEAGRNILGSRTDPIGKNVSIGYHANFRKAVTQPGQNIPEPAPGTEPADPTAEPKMKIPSIAEDSQAIKLVQSTAIGSETLAANNGTAVGYQAQALGNATAAYGFAAIAEGESSLALGTGANAKDGNIALGAGSVALKQDMENKVAALTGTKAKTGIVSVGNAEKGVLRRVTNVGDAVDDQDAVTLAQLRASMTQVSNDLMVKAQGELGKTDLHYDPVAIGGDPSITLQAGDNKSGTAIHNVAKGVHAGDAVNLAQLKEYTEKGMGHYFSTRTTGNKYNFANEGATGENSVAFGIDASATDKYSAAMGNYVQAQGEGSLAIGTGWFNENDKPTIEGTGEEVQPVMTKAYSGYRYNVAIGSGAQTEGNYSMAIGPRALTKKKAYKAESENTGVDYALSMGYLSTVYAKDGLAIGHLAEVHQPNGVAIGTESWSLRNKALAIGNHNTALGRESGTMGTRNGVSGDNSYVIGNDNMNLTDEDRKDVLDTIANASTKGISDNNSTVLGNSNTMVSKFKTTKGLDGETNYEVIDRGEDNHIVGNENTLTRTNHSFVTGSKNELVETTSTFLVGSENKLTNSNTISGVLGEKNEITSHHTTTLGNENKISGDSVKTLGERNEVSGVNLAVIGNDNIQVAGEGSNVFGNANKGVTTENGHVIGFSNKAIAGINQQVLGSFNNTITGKKTHVIGFTNTNVSGEDQRVIGNENNNITGNRNTVLGNKNKEVIAAEDTQLIGNANASISAAQAQILGNSNTKISTKSGHIIGNTNSAIDGEKLSVIGDENSNIAGTQSLLFGYKNNQVQKDTANTQIMGNVNSNIAANRTQIIGNANKVGITKNLKEQGAEGQDVTKEVLEAVKDAQVMGNNNQVRNNYVQVLGNHITTTLDKSVYLGDNAAYNEDETLSATNKDYTKDSIYGYAFAGTKPVGVVTVGAKGNERRIQNVASGLVAATSTDAVNGSQLYQLTRPLHFAGDDSTWGENDDHEKDKNVLHRGSNQNITIKGGADTTKLSDNNIGVTVNTQENVMNVKLAKNLTDLESITFGTDGTSMKIDGKNKSISQIKKVTFGAPDSQDSLVVDGEKKIISGLSNTTWIPKDKRDATFDKSQAATQGQLEAFEESTKRGFDVYVNKDEAANKFTVQLGDENKNDAFGFLAGNNLTVSKDGKQITYALKDDLAVGKEGQDGKDGSLAVHGKDGETVAINGKDGNVTIEGAKDGDSKKNTITMNGKDGTVGINGKDGATVVMNGDGTVVAKGKGEDGKPGASVTIDGKNGITTIEGKTDDNNQKNTITLNGKDGKMGITGKDGSNVTLNGENGSIGMKGKDGANTVQITTKDGIVGVDGTDGTTRLVVKEGTKTHELATMNDGMKFMGDAGTEDKLKLNEQLTVTGGIADTTKLSQDNNIGVIADGKKALTLRLAKNIQGLDTITLGDAEAPMKIDGTTKTISRIKKMVFGVADSTDSLIMDGEKKIITGLSNKTLPTDLKDLKDDQAASQGQLKEVLSKIGKNIDNSADYRLVQDETATDKKYSVNGDGEVVLTVQDIKHPEKKDTVTIKDVAKKSDLTASDKKFTDYAVKYDKNGDTVNKDSITLEGDTKTGTVIKNVGAGSVNKDSKEAVNGSQLYKTNQGFDVYIKDNLDGNTFNVKLGDDTKDAFGFDAGNGLAIARDGKKITYSLQDDVSIGKAGQDGKDGKITVNGKDGESVTINGKNGEIGLQGPKGADGKDGNSVTLSGKDGTIGVQGPKGADGQDGNSVTLNGKDGSIGIKGKDGKNKVDITTGNGKVGLDGKDGETRIIVKDGNKNNELATMNDGLKFKGDDGTAVGVKLNNQVNIVGGAKIVKDGETITNLTDNNIGVESIVDETDGKNAKMKIRLAKNLSDLESITFNSKDKTNPMKIDGDAKTIENIKKMTFGPSSSTDSITVDGENKVITGLSNTTLPTDLSKLKDDQAASQGQLKAILNKATATDDFSVKYDKKDTGEVDKNSVTLGGDTNGTVIKNVKAGDVSENSKEAVNGGQLYKTNQGFDILVGQDTADNRANVALGKANKETVEFAAGNSLEVTLDKNAKKVTYSLKDDITVGKDGEAGKDGKVTVNGKDGEKVTIDGKDGKLESKAKDGTTVTVNGKDGTVGATGADGTTVTMNGKDGTIGGTGKDGTTVTMNAKDGTIGAQGPKGADGKDGASVTINGKDGTTIINGATDENGKKNTITLNGKDGTMGVDGKDGNSVTLNGQDGSIGMKGKDGTNAVSITTQNGTVGVDGKDGTTRLVVKEGTKTHELATMKDGMKFMGDVGTEDKLKLNEQLTVTGGITDNTQLSQDNNIGVIADGQKTLTLRLAKELKGLDGITFGAGDTAMKIDGTQKTINNITKMTFKTPDNKDSIVVDGTNKVITGLSNTTLPKDMSSMQKDQAASQGQLNELLTKVQTEATDYRLVPNAQATDKKYTVDANGDITLTVQDQNHKDKTETVTIKDVAKKSDLTSSDKKFTDYAVKYDKDGDTVNKNSITLEGDTKTGTVIKNVGAGSVNKDSKEAVNGSQLYKTNQGFDVYIKDNTDGNTFNVKLGDDTKEAFGFDAGNGLAIARDGKKITYSLQDDVSIGKAGQDGKDGKITVNGKDGESVTINGKNGEIGIQGPKGADGKDGNSVTLSGKDGTIGVQGPKGADGKDGNSVTLNGKDGSIGIKGKDGDNKVDITTGNGKVGLDGKDGETRIIVKDGNKNNELATMNDGLKFMGDSGTSVGVKLNNQVNIVGGVKAERTGNIVTNLTDNNIGVESIVDDQDNKNAKLVVRLAKNLSDLENITFNSKDKTNPMKINGDAKTIENIKKMTFGPSSSTDSITVDGENKVITGLSNTKLPTDLTKMKVDQAASQGQLKEVLDKATATDDFSVKYDKNTDGSVNKNSITLGGDTNGTVIKNVKAGDVSENSKEAVNGGQLYKTNQGFDILVGQDTADNRANVALGKDSKETVEFAAGNSLEVTLDKNAKKVTYSLKDDITVGKDGEAGKDGKVTVNGKDGEKVTIDGKDGKIESKAKDGTTVTVNGKDGTVGATGTDGTTVTMNGKDGTIGAKGADGTTVTVNGKDGTVGAKGTDGTSVTMNGKDGTIGGKGADGTTVTMNAKDGTIGAQGPKGTNGKDGASVTINGKDGVTTITGATDDKDHKNVIALDGKDGKMGITGKDGNSVTLNGQDGSIDMKGKDGKNAVNITTKDGTVGVNGTDGTTRIVVKDGDKTNELATMNDGMKFRGDFGTEDKLKLNEQLAVTGGITDKDKLSQDNNIGVEANGDKGLLLRLAKELKGLDGITFGAGDTAMKIDGTQKTINNITKMTFKTPDNKDSIVVDGTDKVITGLSNTTLPKDMTTMKADQAASQGQLKEVLDNAVKYDKKPDGTVDTSSITLEGGNDGTVIKNVKAGDVSSNSKDAVNGSQLYKTNQGFDVYVKDNKDANKFAVKLGDDTKDAFGFDAGNGLAIARDGKKITYSLQDDVSIGKTGDNGKDGKITVNGKDGEKVTINGKNGEIGLQGPKGADGKDGNSVTLSGKDGTIGVQGPKGADGQDGNSVTLNGKDGSIGIKGKDGKNKVDITTGDSKVGLDGKDGETRIIVKDGNQNNELATMNDGLKFKGDDGNAIGVKLNKQVNIVGGATIIRDGQKITNLTDNNIGVESIADEADGTNAKMKIRLAKNLSDLESITFNSKDKTNPMTIDGAGRTINDITTLNFLKDGKNNSITGLSNVTWPAKDQRGTDFDVSKAATQGQIQDVENAVDEKLKKSNQGFDILVGEDTEEHRANIALGKDKKETVEFAAGNSLDVTLDKDNKKVIYSLKDDIEVGKEGQPGQAGKDGKVTVNGKDGEKVTIDGKDGKIESKAKDGTTVTVNGKDGTVGATGADGTSVTMNGKDGTIGAQGPKGANGKDGASVTINGKDGVTTITGATDDKDKKNVIALDGKDGKMGVTGKDGNSVTLNGQDGSIDMKGKDGKNAVNITTKDGTVGVNGTDGTTRIVVKDGDKTNELATMNDGMKFMGDFGTEDKLKLNEQLAVTGGITDKAKLSQDNNIGVEANGDKGLLLRLAKELKGLDGITFGAGDTAMKIDGTQKTINNITKMTFKTPDNKDSIVVDGTNKVITGLSNTTLPKDLKDLKADQAASQGQLKEVLDNAVKYDKKPDGTVDTSSITLEGGNDGTVIKNVKAGDVSENSKEAINGSQLYKTNQGFDILVGEDTEANRANVALGQDKKETVKFDAGKNLSASLDKASKKVSYRLKDEIVLGEEKTADATGINGKITIHGTTGEKMTMDGKNGEVIIETTDENGKKNEVFLKSHDGTMGVTGKENNGVTLHGEGFVRIKGAGSDKAIDLTTEKGQVGVDGQGSSTRLLMKEGNIPHALATMDDGLKFMGDSGTTVGVKLNNQINIVGGVKAEKEGDVVKNLTDNNIGVESIVDDQNGKNAKMKIRLAKKLSDMESITFNSQDKTNPMTIDGAGRTIKDITTINFLKDGKNNSITGLSNVTWPTKEQRGSDFDVSKAATQGQIQDVENAVDEKFKKSNAGFDVYIKEKTNENTFNIALGKDEKEAFGFLAGNGLEITRNDKEITYAMKDDITLGHTNSAGQDDGKDGKFTVTGKDGNSVTVDGKDGKLTLASATDDKGKTNQIALNGKDGSVRGDGKSGNAFEMNADAGTVGAKGADGSAVVLNGKDGTIGMNGKDGKNKVTIGTQEGKVGIDGTDGTTRVVVKDGDKTNELATMNDGLKFKGDSGDVVNRKLNETLSIEGGADTTKLSDKNIGVVTDAENGKMLVKLAKDLKDLTSVETKDDQGNTTNMTGAGVTTKDDNGNITATTATGMKNTDAAGHETNTTASGVVAKDKDKNETSLSATGTVVKDKDEHETSTTATGVITKDKDGNQTTVSAASVTTEDKDKNTNVSTAKDITVADKDGNKTVINKEGMTITHAGQDVISLTKDGLNNGGKTITGVATGVNDTDAVNVKQLKDEIEKNRTKLEGSDNIAVSGSGKEGDPFKVALKDDITLGKKNSAGQDDGKDGKFTVTGKDGNSVIVDGKDGIVETKGKDGTTVTMNGKDGKLTLASATDDKGKKNQIALNGKDGSVHGDGKSGNAFEMNADAGTVGAKGADGSAVVLNGKDGTIDMNGKDGKNKVTIGTQEGKVGIDGTNGTTRVVVKEGDKTNELATMNDGLKFKGDSGDVVNRKLNETLSIEGGADPTKLSEKNIGVVTDAENGKMSVKLAKDLKDLTSVETKDDQGNTTNMTGAGTTTTDTKGNTTTTNATGVTTTDGKGNTTTTTVDGVTTADKDGNSTTIKKDGITIQAKDKNTVSLTDKGLDNGGNKLTSITDGDISKDSKDAVNGGQLYKTNQGFDVLVGEDKAENRANVALGKDKKETVEFAAGNGLIATIDKDTKKITYAMKDTIEIGKKGEKDGKLVVNGKDGESITMNGKDGIVETKGTDGTTVTMNGKDGTVGATGKDGTSVTMNGKDGTVGAKGTDGTTVTMNGKDGTISAQGPKGADGKDGASVTINGKDGTTTINGATDKDGKKNTISLNGKDGKMGVTGKDGNSVTLNGQDGSIGMKGKDGKNTVQITTKDGKVGVDGKDGETRIVVKDGDKVNELATMNDGLKFKGDSGDVVNRKLNETLSIEGDADTTKLSDKNIGVVTDAANGKMLVKLAKEIKGLDRIETKVLKADNIETTSMTMGDVTVNENGLTIKKGPAVTKQGIDAGFKPIRNVAPGVIAPNSLEAVNGGQLFGTEMRVAELGGRIGKVGAGAAALAGLHPLDFDPDNKWDFAAGYGNYSGNSAFALGAYYRPSESSMISFGGTVGNDRNMYNVGVSLKMGSGENNVTGSRIAMAREIIDLRKENDGLKGRLDAMERKMNQVLTQLDAPKDQLYTPAMYPDTPDNHWAYEYIKQLQAKNMLGAFQNMANKAELSRHEMAQMIYAALKKGAPVDDMMDRALSEFENEIRDVRDARIRVDRLKGDVYDESIDRVRVNPVYDTKQSQANV